MMKNRPGEKIKLASLDELLGVVNEESAMEIHRTSERKRSTGCKNRENRKRTARSETENKET